MRLRDRTVIVTGASSGIGLETAREFARAGCNVVLASRNQERLERLAEELSSLPGQRLAVATDVSRREQVEAMVERAVATFGGVDILVNNAGLGLSATVADGDMDNMRYLFDVNLWGAIHCLRAAVPHMRRRKRGLIVNVSSVAGRIAVPYNAIYCATKAALISLSDALRLELAEDGIRVLTVYPGLTATEFGSNSVKEVELPGPSPLLRGVTARAVARVIVKAARRGQREAFVTLGDRVAVGAKYLSPRLVDWGLRRLWLASRRPKPLARK
jgi:short-subunit dehydrogenase